MKVIRYGIYSERYERNTSDSFLTIEAAEERAEYLRKVNLLPYQVFSYTIEE